MSSRPIESFPEFVLHGAFLFYLQITNDVIENVEQQQQQLVILEAQSSTHPADSTLTRVVHVGQASEERANRREAQGNHPRLSKAPLLTIRSA